MGGVLEVPLSVFSNKRYDVIKAIDRFGAITSLQLERYLKEVSRTTIYRARLQGNEFGYIHERNYGGRSLIAITDAGAQFIGKNHKGESLLNDDMYHRIISNEVLFTFLEDYQNKGVDYLDYKTERDIMRDVQLSMSLKELNKPNRIKNLMNEIPDIILNVNHKKIAIEVELSPKSNNRLKRKLKLYKNSLDKGVYDSVVYICGNHYIQKSVEKMSDYLKVGLKFIMLEDIIDSEEV